MNPFTRAADYLIEHGWTTGMVRDYATGRVCAYGAILYGNPDASESQIRRLVGWLSRFIAPRLKMDPYGGLADLVPYWNDRLAEGSEEIVTMLREAAEAWELETELAGTAEPDAIQIPESWMPSLTAIQSGFTLDSWVPTAWAQGFALATA